MTGDLTLNDYRTLLDALARAGRAVGGVADWLEGRLESAPAVVLRHDVDRRVAKAAAMAAAERRLGVRATYYFRAGRRGFPADAIRAVAALGHEVGYHYETLSACRGDRAAALRRFGADLDGFRRIAECRTVAPHGAPLSRHDNRTLLADGGWRTFGLTGDAVHSFAGAEIRYLTDTGGRWNAGESANRRDRIAAAPAPGAPRLRSTAGVAALVLQGRPALYLNVHPERWAWSRPDAAFCRAADGSANLLKAVIRRFLG